MVLLKSLATPVVWVLLLLIAGLILVRRPRGRKLRALGERPANPVPPP